MSLEISKLDLGGIIEPLHRRILVLCIPHKQKVGSLYVPNPTRGAFTQAQHVWIYSWASDCKFEWTRGFHGLINDAFELEPYDFDLASSMSDEEKALFKSAFDYASETESEIKSVLIHETAIMAEVMDPVAFGEDHQD